MESHAIALQPFSVTGLTVLGIFTVCMAAIVLEAKLHMDKFKPALLMLLSWLVTGYAAVVFMHWWQQLSLCYWWQQLSLCHA